MDDFHYKTDDLYMPEFGHYGKKKPESEWGPSEPLNEWFATPNETDIITEELTMEFLMDKITKVEGEVQELKVGHKEMNISKILFPENRSEEALQFILDISKKHKIKDKELNDLLEG